MRVKLVSETKPEEMNESQWNVLGGQSLARANKHRALLHFCSPASGLIRLADLCIKRTLGKVLLADLQAARCRMIAALIEAAVFVPAPGACCWRCFNRRPNGALLRSDTDIKLEMISFVPSCNTDQGAFYSREYWRDENLNAQWKW